MVIIRSQWAELQSHSYQQEGKAAQLQMSTGNNVHVTALNHYRALVLTCNQSPLNSILREKLNYCCAKGLVNLVTTDSIQLQFCQVRVFQLHSSKRQPSLLKYTRTMISKCSLLVACCSVSQCIPECLACIAVLLPL